MNTWCFVQDVWLVGSFAGLWCHFDNVWRLAPGLAGFPGPRTTNHAEGYHRDLDHDFGNLKPNLPSFLHWLQGANNAADMRIASLLHPTEPRQPRSRDSRYVAVDENLRARKLALCEQLAHTHPLFMLPIVMAYLSHVLHLLYRTIIKWFECEFECLRLCVNVLPYIAICTTIDTSIEAMLHKIWVVCVLVWPSIIIMMPSVRQGLLIRHFY